MKLELELIPEKQWGKSLAHLLPKPVWDTLRREVYAKFNYTCSICSAFNCRVNCHEVWWFDDKRKVQKLVGFQCLCDSCHSIKHWGRTVAMVHKGELPTGTLEALTRHFCEVNSCTTEEFETHKIEMGTLFQFRSQHKYRLDFGKFAPDRVVKIWLKKKK